MFKPLALASLVTLSLTVSRPSLACDTCKTPGLHIGETRILGNGTIYSWLNLNEKGEPPAIGVTLTETALEGLPANPPSAQMPGMEYTLRLPKQASVTAFDHIGFDWNPKGHEPSGIYDK